jgi:hypothetical protein
MMPGARSFFMARVLPLILPMGRERRLQSVLQEGPLFSPSSPRPFIFVFLHLYAAPQDVGFRVWYSTGAIDRYPPESRRGYAGSWIRTSENSIPSTLFGE